MNLLQATPQTQIDTDYYVTFSPETYIILVIGCKHNHSTFTFTHPNVLSTQYKMFEFKHSRTSGSKFWTSCLGKDIYLAIAKEKLDLILDKGYSYVPVSYQGMKFVLNVSGGTGGLPKSWGDYVGRIAHTSVNLSKKLLTALADAALSQDERAYVDFTPIPIFENERIALALQEWEAKQRCVLAVGSKIALKPGWKRERYSKDNSPHYLIKELPTKWRKKYLCAGPTLVPIQAIDWIETAAINKAA